MKYSNKGDAPRSFIDWRNGEQETHGHLPPYSNLQNPEKENVRQSLMTEQGYLCVYCGQSLESNFSGSHIDHFWPQATFNGSTVLDDGSTAEDRRVCYSNFFMSCNQTATCGTAKGDWYDTSNHIIPSDQGCEDRFKYTGVGKIEPQRPCDTAADNMIRCLKLDNPALEYDRKKIVQEIEQKVFSGNTNSETVNKIEAEIGDLTTPDTDGRLRGYSQVSMRYLKEERQYLA